MLRSFYFRAYPEAAHEQLLRRTIGCVRFVYNKALADGETTLDLLSKKLTEWKQQEDLAFLCEVSCVPLQQSLRHLWRNYKKFFDKKAGRPGFKRKEDGGSATFTQNAFKWDAEKQVLTLAKMKTPLNIRWSRKLPIGNPKLVTVTLNSIGHWHVSIQCEDLSVKALPVVESAIGIDVGLETLVTTSAGRKIPNPRHRKRRSKRERLLAKRLSRKKKGSKNRDKARIKMARHSGHIAACRRDDLDKLSTQIVHENQVIVIEDLSIKNMVRDRSLAAAIYDAGWGELFRQLKYKCAWYGRSLLVIDRWYPSSKTCSCCGHVLDHLPRKARQWTCPACKTEHDRDVNAARNILAAGLAVSACGPDVRRHILQSMALSGMKQENISATK